MSNESNSLNPARAALKLSDTQLVLLSAAARRDDLCLTAIPKVKGGAALKVAEKLLAAGLVREIEAEPGTPVWRRDGETARSFALQLTAAGLEAIAVDDFAIEEEPAEPAHLSSEAICEDERAGARADHGAIPSGWSGGPEGRSQRPGQGEAPPAPRPGSKGAEIVGLLQRDQGATIDELIALTDWLPHTTRASLTGLRKRGYEITRSRAGGVTRYKIETVGPASAGTNSAAKQREPSQTADVEKAV